MTSLLTLAVTVTLRLAAPGVVQADYMLPPDCARLPFEKTGEGVRAGWQAVDACAAADGAALTRKNAQCTALRFRIPASSARRDGYPAAYPIGAGIYVHTSNYATTAACGPVHYRFEADTIALDRRVQRGHAEGDDGDAGVLLLPAPITGDADMIAYYDPTLGPAATAQIERVARGTIGYLKAALPGAPFRMPVLAAGRVGAPGNTRIDGDASDVLRLGFVNWPAQPAAEDQHMMTLLVAHEFSHRFQLRDAYDAQPDARLIHEGGAEFLRWAVSLQQGWMTRAEAAVELDTALADCLLATGMRSWRAMEQRIIASRRLAYRCGLPAYVYALAAGSAHGPALERFAGLYAHGPLRDWARQVECGAARACEPVDLHRLLDGQAPMRSAWEEFFVRTGFARPAPPDASQRKQMMMQAFEPLMRADCGSVSYYPFPDGLQIDPEQRGCKLLRPGARITHAEGLRLFDDPQALQAMSAACKARHAVRLSDADGASMELPCSQPYDAEQQFFAADIGRVLAALKLPPAPLPAALPAAGSLPTAQP